MFGFLNNVPAVNKQALVAMALFGLSLLLARIVVNIQSGRWPGNQMFVLYLRVLLGFVFAASIALAFYSFAGQDILFSR